MKEYPFLDLGRVNAPFADELKAAMARAVDSGRYVGGPENAAFEAALGEKFAIPHVVGVSNGLDALRLIFRGLIELGRLAEGDEVLVPANTYIASVLAVSDCGLRPVFVEPDEATMNIDSRLLEKYIGPRTRALLTVHLYGRTAYDAAMADVVSRHNLILVEDNAQAIGAVSPQASPRGTHATGSLGHASAFSFYPTKNLGALGDAGAVGCTDPELAAAVRALANYGSDRRYHNVYKGYNCRLDPVQAAVLNVKLPHLDAENARRREIAAVYEAEIDNPLIVKPLFADDGSMVWHQYVLRTEHREAFRAYLRDNGVGSDVHYAVPPHLQPCYKEYAALDLPATCRLADEVVSIPVSACTTADDARDIARIINRFKP